MRRRRWCRIIPDRLGKNLRAQKEKGANLRYYEARDAQAEAEFVAGELERILSDDPDQTCAVEYRTNFQSRSFEEVFRRRGIRYKLVGGFSFYNRAEVKDALAYVRLALHPEDDISLLRVLNVPARGIGKTTVDALREIADREKLSLWDAIESLMTNPASTRAIAPLRAFRELVVRLREAYNTKEPAEFLRFLLEETGYMPMLRDRNTPDDVARMENLEELARAVAESQESRRIVHGFSGRRGAGQRCRFVRRQTRRHADHVAQHQGVGVRSRVSDWVGRRHLSAQPLGQRRERYRRGTAACVRGNDSSAKFADVDARCVPPHFRQRTADARFPAEPVSGARFRAELGGYGARINGGDWRIAALRARSGIFVFRGGVCAAGPGNSASSTACPAAASFDSVAFVWIVGVQARQECRPVAGAKGTSPGVRRGHGCGR